MNPFLKLSIGIVNVDQQQKTVDARFQPEQVDYYYPGFHNGTVVVLKSGNSFLTSLPVESFDKMLDNYHER